jgi:hypothetical protein
MGKEESLNVNSWAMIQPSPFFYAPEARELSGGYHELQNAIAAINLNHRSIGDAQSVAFSKIGMCPHIVA